MLYIHVWNMGFVHSCKRLERMCRQVMEGCLFDECCVQTYSILTIDISVVIVSLTSLFKLIQSYLKWHINSLFPWCHCAVINEYDHIRMPMTTPYSLTNTRGGNSDTINNHTNEIHWYLSHHPWLTKRWDNIHLIAPHTC